MCIPKELEQVISEFQKNGLWGQIQLDFQRGKLVVIRKQVTIRPGDGNNVRSPKRDY